MPIMKNICICVLNANKIQNVLEHNNKNSTYACSDLFYLVRGFSLNLGQLIDSSLHSTRNMDRSE